MASEREVFIDLEPGLRIRFRRSEAPPPVSYAITLELYEVEAWTAVRLWDNAAADDLGLQVGERCNGGGDSQSQG